MKYKILMLGKPGGTLARTYEWHIEALNSDISRRYKVDCIYNKGQSVDIKEYNIFWFYAKAFNPSLYHHIIKERPDAKVVCGPNVLLDKPDIGLSDEWDNWYANSCRPDVHLDQVHFYSEHVKKFLSNDTRKVAKTLDKCMKINDSYYNPNTAKIYDCLVYSKKRRYDYKFEKFRDEIVRMLKKNDISYYEIKSGKFGNYKREEYFDALNKSKVTINLSLDECPGILNYESMFFNVPVIGSPNNTPITSSKNLYVYDTDKMTDKYLVRKDDASKKYFKVIKNYLSNKKDPIDHRSFIINHTSFQRYCENVNVILESIL